jgi:peroxiredoxin
MKLSFPGNLSFLTCLCLTTVITYAQPAYEIKANIKPFRQGHLYLAHHFGSKQYLVDSALINSKGDAVFSGNEKLKGGVYMIAFPEKNGWIECIIDKQQRFSVTADTADQVGSIAYTGSSDNVLFADYQKQSYQTGMAISEMRNKLVNASPADAEKIRADIQARGMTLQRYRENFIKAHPEHLLSAIFHVLKEPVIPPAEKHPGAKYDSVFAYRYYMEHYWDDISLTDERLIRTPVFQSRIDRYFDDLLPQHPDTLSRAAGMLIDKSKGNPEMFKYLLSHLTDKYVNPRYMGQDAVFVHLFEKYYLTGQADSWMNEKYRKFIFDRGYSLMANIVGKPAGDFEFIDTAGRKRNLYGVDAPYIVLCFWDPTCGHCKEEVPRLDSLYRAKWKSRGVRIVGMMTDGGKDAWLKFIREHDLKDWLHVYQTQELKDADMAAKRPSYRQLYDVYQTPTIFLLDREKRILAKKITYQQTDELLQLKFREDDGKK